MAQNLSNDPTNGYRAGFVGLIGQPNAGKSSLLNFLIKDKVSIVTSKPQTTRRRIHGLWSDTQGQIIFVDAPGVIQAEKGLNGFLALEAQEVIAQSDSLLAVVSVDEKNVESAEQIIKMVAQAKKPWMVVITKTDLQDKFHRIEILKTRAELIAEQLHSLHFFKGVKRLSIKTDKEPERLDLLHHIQQLLPLAPAPLYDPEWLTTENTKDLVAEMIREQCFEFLHHEIPYNLAVRVVQFNETEHAIPHIECEILVSRDSHRAIVIGQQGQVIKQIGQASRLQIEKFLNQKVFLGLKVVYREDWFNNPRIMRELGYAVNNS